jgi:hypothetical protein
MTLIQNLDFHTFFSSLSQRTKNCTVLDYSNRIYICILVGSYLGVAACGGGVCAPRLLFLLVEGKKYFFKTSSFFDLCFNTSCTKEHFSFTVSSFLSVLQH